MKSIDFMNNQMDIIHSDEMFAWMHLFTNNIKQLEDLNKKLIQTIPCGINNEPGYSENELKLLQYYCSFMPKSLVAQRKFAEADYCLGIM